jgi:hypothetical protein
MSASETIKVTYSPERIELGRVFRVVLHVPRGQTPVNQSLPAGVEVVDRTDPGKAGETIFFLRASRVNRGAVCRFDGKSDGVEITLDCLDREGILERREQGEIRLPRRWPLWEDVDELKSGRSIWRKNDLERALDWGSKHPEDQVRKDAEAWASKSDETLWNSIAKPEIPRWHFGNLNVGCPIHGDSIFKYSGYYPWETDVEGMPYKVQCPVGGEWYPSNNIEEDDYTSGDYPDDGYGCVHGDTKWAFVGVYQNARGYHFNRGIKTLSDAYVRTGDERLLHKIRVMLLKMADEWAYLSGVVEERFRFGGDDLHYQVDPPPRWPIHARSVADLNRSGLINYCISLAGDFVTYATAYDLAWEGLDEDAEFIKMAGTRLGLQSGEETRRYIEDHVFRVGAQAAMDGGAHSNLPHPQMGLTALTLAMNYKAGVNLADWLWNGGGQMRYWIPNFFFRDGSAYESTGGYNGMHVDATPPIAKGLSRLQELRPEEYKASGISTFEADPKSKMLYAHLAELVCIGRMYPQIGDGGGRPQEGNPPLGNMYSMSNNVQTSEYAFETYGDAIFARSLWLGEEYEPGPESAVSLDDVASLIRAEGEENDFPSQVFDGYGIAVLRSGSGDQARALWLRYGHARGHRQDDMLDIGLFAHQRNFMSQLGYPYTWSTHALWDANWLTHYRLKVQGISPDTWYRGALHSVSLSPNYQAARADGEAFRDLGKGETRYAVDPDQPYSRGIALIDVNDQDFYALDIHRARGGDQHWWSFRGPHGDVSTEGLQNVVSWEKGTPAGEHIGYGETDKLDTDDPNLLSLAYLYNCERGEVVGPWGASWTLSGDSGLALHMRQLAQDGEVIMGDGKPPISSMDDPPYKFRWAIAHRTGNAPLDSRFVTLIEATESGRRIVKNIESLPVVQTTDVLALGIETETTQDMVVNCQASGTVTPVSEDWTFTGETGFARRTDDGTQQVTLTGGGSFCFPDLGILSTTNTFTARVIGGDFSARQVLLEAATLPIDALVGQHVRFDSPNRSSTYRVTEVTESDEGVCLTLDIDIRIGEGTADAFENGRIISHTHFPLAGFRYYHGANLTTDSGEVIILDHIEPDAVANIESGLRPLSKIIPSHPESNTSGKLEAAFGEGKSFRIYDLAVGHTATFTVTSFIRKTGSGKFEARIGSDTTIVIGNKLEGTASVSIGTKSFDIPIVEQSGQSTLDLSNIGAGDIRVSV